MLTFRLSYVYTLRPGRLHTGDKVKFDAVDFFEFDNVEFDFIASVLSVHRALRCAYNTIANSIFVPGLLETSACTNVSS